MELIGGLSFVGNKLIVSLEFGDGGIERLCCGLEEALETGVPDLRVVKVL